MDRHGDAARQVEKLRKKPSENPLVDSMPTTSTSGRDTLSSSRIGERAGDGAAAVASWPPSSHSSLSGGNNAWSGRRQTLHPRRRFDASCRPRTPPPASSRPCARPRSRCRHRSRWPGAVLAPADRDRRCPDKPGARVPRSRSSSCRRRRAAPSCGLPLDHGKRPAHLAGDHQLRHATLEDAGFFRGDSRRWCRQENRGDRPTPE